KRPTTAERPCGSWRITATCLTSAANATLDDPVGRAIPTHRPGVFARRRKTGTAATCRSPSPATYATSWEPTDSSIVAPLPDAATTSASPSAHAAARIRQFYAVTTWTRDKDFSCPERSDVRRA